MQQGRNENTDDDKWYLDEYHTGQPLPAKDSRGWRRRGAVRWVMRAYWLSLLHAVAVISVAVISVAAGTGLRDRDAGAIVLIALAIVGLVAIVTVVVGHLWQSKRLVYKAWEQAAFFFAHITVLLLGLIGSFGAFFG